MPPVTPITISRPCMAASSLTWCSSILLLFCGRGFEPGNQPLLHVRVDFRLRGREIPRFAKILGKVVQFERRRFDLRHGFGKPAAMVIDLAHQLPAVVKGG